MCKTLNKIRILIGIKIESRIRIVITMPIHNTNAMTPMMISGSGKRAMTDSQDIQKKQTAAFTHRVLPSRPLLLSAAKAGRNHLNE